MEPTKAVQNVVDEAAKLADMTIPELRHWAKQAHPDQLAPKSGLSRGTLIGMILRDRFEVQYYGRTIHEVEA